MKAEKQLLYQEGGGYGRSTVHTYVMVWQPEVAMWYAHGAVTTQ